MDAQEFKQLLTAGKLYIEDESSALWMRKGFQSEQFSFDGDIICLAARCSNAYNKVKQVVKEKYFRKNISKITISRYKRAAIISNVVLGVRPFKIDRAVSPEDKAFLINEYFAFYLGLHSLLIDFSDEYINHYKNENPDIFKFPTPSNGDAYIDIVAKELYFSMLYKNYNILSMADKYYLLLKGFSGLDTSVLKQLEEEEE